MTTDNRGPLASQGAPLTPEMWETINAHPLGLHVKTYGSTNSAYVAVYRLRRDPHNDGVTFHVRHAGDGLFQVITGPTPPTED